ncbi:MAG TPA: PIG-L family deacetylase [Thermoanaerobaculia bacterium]|nr:PIG-L family deacetylase [Thermoanaerobaculia bacterium]
MRRLILVLVLILVPAAAHARTAAELQLALRKLNVLGSALYIAAHPDDENTALLAWLANERLYRSGYLSVTRGDGGQNLIGEEKGELLGVIRTQELLAARRIDRAEQLFTRAIDFGYSKSAQETMRIWGENDALADVVWAIRRFQPDVIITRFPSTGEGGHGQHTASAILAEQAFTAAGDPSKFPEQLKHVGLWSPARIFFNRFSFRGPIDPNDPAVAKSLRVDLGTYNPLLGRAYTEIAAESRSLHKSQGFGSAERRGTILNYFDHRNGATATKDLFEGIDTSWARVPGGERAGAILKQAADTFDPDKPSASLPLLLDAWDALVRLGVDPAVQKNVWFHVKRDELLEVIRDCAGIAIDVAAAESFVVNGGELSVSVTVVNRSDYPFHLSLVGSPYANPNFAPGTKLENNKPVKTDLKLRAFEYGISQPYWLQKPITGGMFTVEDPTLIGTPENKPSLPIYVTLEDPSMHTLTFAVPVTYRRTDPVAGEQIRNVDVVPEVTANFGSGVYIFAEAKPRIATVWLRSFGATDATLRLIAPPGWKIEPASASVKFAGKGDETRVAFTVTPPVKEDSGKLIAEVELPNGKKLSLGLTNIEYPHIPAQRVFGDSFAKLVRADIKRRGNRVGYIMGSGDDIPNILRQVGYEVTLLSDADLDRGDFAMYDAIVTGIRAYNTRKRLRLAHEKLMQYVEKGGTVVVQYNTSGDDLAVPAPGPFPFKISRDRVTVEDAPVKLIDADHPLLSAPNKITAKDFEGWVQERGLYFTTEWDPRYTTVLATNDPGEPEKPGGQLFAKHGKGAFVYTAYAWWRQLPGGVAGAIRAFVNLVSAE